MVYVGIYSRESELSKFECENSRLEANATDQCFKLESNLEAKSILNDNPQTYQNEFKSSELLLALPKQIPNMHVW